MKTAFGLTVCCLLIAGCPLAVFGQGPLTPPGSVLSCEGQPDASQYNE